MASMKEIRAHMNSIRETQKITNAMYMIASTKLRKARATLNQTRPWFLLLQREIKGVYRYATDLKSRYFEHEEGGVKNAGTYACLVITADKGLAGAYNMNVIRKAERLLAAHADTKLFVVGAYGRHYFESRHIPVEHSFLYTAQNPTMPRAREISAMLMDMYDRGEISKIFVVYTDMKNSITEQATATRILPLHRQLFEETGITMREASPYEFRPSPRRVLEALIPGYVSGVIYGALVDSFCSEQSARMTAMDNANRNAEKLLEELSTEYNRVRQAAITMEITEVSAGAKARRARLLAEARRRSAADE